MLKYEIGSWYQQHVKPAPFKPDELAQEIQSFGICLDVCCEVLGTITRYGYHTTEKELQKYGLSSNLFLRFLRIMMK